MAAAAPDATVDLFAISPGRGDGDELARKLPLLAEGAAPFPAREGAPDERRLARARRLAPSAGRSGRLGSPRSRARAGVGATGVPSERSPAPSASRGSGATRSRRLLPRRVALRGRPQLCRRLPRAGLSTPSKPAERTLGADGFACRAAGLSSERGLPVYALGGIGLDHLPLLARRGVTRVAAIRLFFDAADPRRAVEAARAALRRA